MIYICAPAYKVSGGPEALQQMCYYLRSLGKESIIVFYDYEEGKDPMPDRYKLYGNKWVLFEDLKDEDGDICVVPEVRTRALNGIKKARRYIWWLSKDYLIYEKASIWKKFKYYGKKFLHIDVISLDTRYCNFDLKDVTHLCGSKYAYEYVRNVLKLADVHYCVEPISLEFLQMGTYVGIDRKDVVLYNPSKPSVLMGKLLERGKFDFIPLKGYTPEELAGLYKSSKLYVDFGAFPGPERIPKEMVYFGGQILVGFQNAAMNDFDVAIPEKYKIKNLEDVEFVEKMISVLLNNTSSPYFDFSSFQAKVANLETEFKKQLNALF